MDFLNAQEGWAAGQSMPSDRGILLHTADGGENWVRMVLPGDMILALRFASSQDGWLLAQTGCDGSGCSGLTVLGTTDAGQTWRSEWKAPVNSNGQAVNVIVRSRIDVFGRTAFALALGHLVTTANGGNAWHPLALPDGEFPVDASFSSATHGWVVAQSCAGGGMFARRCAPAVFTTSDGGRKWTRVFAPELTRGYETGSAAVSFADARHGWLFFKDASLRGRLYATEDGGHTWILVNSNLASTRTVAGHPVFVNGRDGWMPVDEGAAPLPGGVWATTDGGMTWRNTAVGKDWSIAALQALPGRRRGAPLLWAVGDRPDGGGFLARSADGGKTWQQLLPAPSPVVGITFVDGRHGMGIGTVSDPDAVLVTADGGKTWTLAASLEVRPIAVAEQSASDAWMVAVNRVNSGGGRPSLHRRRPDLAADRPPLGRLVPGAAAGIAVSGHLPSPAGGRPAANSAAPRGPVRPQHRRRQDLDTAGFPEQAARVEHGHLVRERAGRLHRSPNVRARG